MPAAEQPSRLALLPAALVAVFALSAGAVAGYAPPATGEMAVVFPPWVDEAQGLAGILAAGGKIVGPTRFGNIVVAYGPDAGFGARVRAAGAWLVLAGTGLCSPDPVATPGI
jgi:hypothetical protein